MGYEEYVSQKEVNDRIMLSKDTHIANREFFEDDAMQSFDPNYRELPEYYDERSSIYLESTLYPSACVYPEAVAIEGLNLRKELDSLFQLYSVAEGRSPHYRGPAPPVRRLLSTQPP